MRLSLMTFSMIKDAALGQLNAQKLCAVAKRNNLAMLDMMDFEIKLYGMEKLRRAFSEYGVHCGCLITTIPIYTAPDRIQKNCAQALDMAKKIGADCLMIVPGRAGKKEQMLCAGLTKQQILDKTVDAFRTAVEMAKLYEIKVGFENTPHDYKPLAAAEDVQYVLDHVPGLGLIFDTGNFRVADTDCDEVAIYKQLKRYIIRVHLKDVVVGRFSTGEKCVDGQRIRAVTTGSGVIPMQSLLEHMKLDSYDGVMAIEYAAPARKNGKAHADAIAPYCQYIRNVWEGCLQEPPYREIPGVRIPVSRIFFGTAMMPMMMGKNVDDLLDGILAAGINAFDCARGYGKAEKALGRWVKNRNNRNRIVILSKCGNARGNKVCVNRKVIEAELEQSLQALQTEYIDIYLLHRDDPDTPVSEIIDCLNEAQKAGKIHVFGVSNWTHDRICEANSYAKEHGLNGFCVSSLNFGLAEQVVDPWGGGCITISGSQNAGARQWYKEKQMPVIAYSSLGRGFFSGKFKAGDYKGAKKVLDMAAQKGYLYECNMKRLKVAEELAERDHCTVPQIALRYIFGSDMNIFAVISSSSTQRMQENITAANWPLSIADVNMLELQSCENSLDFFEVH